jgi:hypothetical protein
MDAWQDFCDRMANLGRALTGPPFPTGSERDRVEGAHHLANQVATWLTWAVGADSVTHPRFFRQNDLFFRWGGPNVDQVTRRATLDPAGTYRICGALGACQDFILTMKDGDMHDGRYGVAFDVLGSELGFGPGADVEIHLGGEAQTGEGRGVRLAIPEGASMLNIREYYWDWTAAAPATLVIERLDTLGTPPPPLTEDDLAARLDKAARLVEASVTYWNDWVERERAKLPPNTMGPAGGSAGGSSRIAYSFGFYDLADDEALVVEAGPPPSPYWDIQLYSLGWFESYDFANRTTSLNHTQARLSPGDGRFRAVVAHTDPGTPNWLDTEGRGEGMLTHRWIGGPPAEITAEVVPLAELRDHLPADTPAVTAGERADEIRARQSHAAWRYRV